MNRKKKEKKGKKGHKKSQSMQKEIRPAQSIETTLHGYAMEGPYTPGPKDVWYCDNKQCKYTQHGIYRRYNIENWRSSKFGRKFVLCDGCVRMYRKNKPQIHHQHTPSAPNVHVNLNIQGGFQQQGGYQQQGIYQQQQPPQGLYQQGQPQPYYGQQPMTIIQPMTQPMSQPMAHPMAMAQPMSQQPVVVAPVHPNAMPMAQPMPQGKESFTEYEDYGQRSSSTFHKAKTLTMTNAKIGALQSNGIYAPRGNGHDDQKMSEGMYTGPLSHYSNNVSTPEGASTIGSFNNMYTPSTSGGGGGGGGGGNTNNNNNMNDNPSSAASSVSPKGNNTMFNGTTLGHGIHIVQQGWMMKQGGLVKNWKRRYFVLKTNKVMNYYESDNSSMVKGYVQLTEVSSVEKKQKLQFDIVTPKRTWNFTCDSTQARDEWVTNISSIAGIR